MEDVIDPLAKAARHHAAARAAVPTPSSTFALSTSAVHNQFCRVPKTTKTKLVGNVQIAVAAAVGRPWSEREATQVFHSQSPNSISTSAYSSSEPVNNAGDARKAKITEEEVPLPGGVPLIDLMAVYIDTRPELQELRPDIEDMRNSRLPTPQELNNEREVTIGVSKLEAWMDGIEFLKLKAKEGQDIPFNFMAADTESIPLKITWPKYPGSSTWESLLLYISMQAASGVDKLEFTVARGGESACGLPTRFFFGNREWQFHIRMPVIHYRRNGETKVSLRLDTELTEVVKQLFLMLPSMVGAGITEDYVEWNAILEAVWYTSFFTQMRKPIELEHLARAARINTINSSIFHLNWWCFGTVLPKGIASIGDGKWGQPLSSLPPSLRQYLVADIVQTVKIARFLALKWILQTVPDMTMIRDASSFTITQFLQWSHQKLVPILFTGIRGIIKDSSGKWLRPERQDTWVEQDNAAELVKRLNPPTLSQYPAIWSIPDWPSITCGGPRSIHQIRLSFITILPELRSLDPDSWMIHHKDKLLYWCFGVAPVDCSASLAPIPAIGFARSPTIDSALNNNPSAWTRLQFDQSKIHIVRSDRMLIYEFARLDPDRALSVLTFIETQRTKFRLLVGESRMQKIVVDIRNLLALLNSEPIRPAGWVDPYRINEHRAAKVLKRSKHMDLRFSQLMAKSERLQQQAMAIKRPRPQEDDMDIVSSSSDVHISEEPSRKIRVMEEPEQTSDSTRSVRYIKDLEAVEESIRTVKFREEEEEDIVEVLASTPTNISLPAPSMTYKDILLDRTKSSATVAASISTPVITHSMSQIIHQALIADDEDLVNKTGVVKITGADIRRTDMNQLPRKRYLNDDIMAAYFQLISERGGKNGLPSVYTVSTYFFPMLERIGYQNARQFTKRVDIFSYDLVFIPINYTQPEHWALVAVNMGKRTVTYYDSLLNQSRGSCVGVVNSFLAEEYCQRKGGKLPFQFRSLWPETTPQQENGFDCGMYVLRFAEQLSRNCPSFNIPQHEMPLYRQLIVWEIVTNQLYSSAFTDLDDDLIIGIDSIEMEDFKPSY